MLERIKEAVTETFGEKCPDFDANCHGCQAWAEVERLDCPPLSGKPMVTDATQLLEQGDRAHAALCRELRIQTSLVGDLTAALRRALSDAPAREGDMTSLGQPVTFTYTNWRGETAQRTAVPKRLWFGTTEWHPEPGWLMTAYDLEKASDRDFALADCAFAPAREVTVREAELQWIQGSVISTDDDNGPLEGIAHSLRAWSAGCYTILQQRGPHGRFILKGTMDGYGHVLPTLDAAKEKAAQDRTLSQGEKG